MATVTGLTAERMLEIEASSVVDGDVVAGNLILSKHELRGYSGCDPNWSSGWNLPAVQEFLRQGLTA